MPSLPYRDNSFFRVPLGPGHMGPVAIEVEGIEELRDLPLKFKAALMKELQVALNQSNRLLFTTLIPKIPEDLGGALKSIKVIPPVFSTIEVSGGIESDLPYMSVLEFGRAPGSMPPVDPIYEWVRRKFAGANQYTTNAIAWAVAENIKINGMKGKHMWEETWLECRPQIERNFAAAVDRALAAI